MFFPFALLAQKEGQREIDSLLHELPHAKEDTNKVKLLNDISGCYNTVDPIEGIKYGEQGMRLAMDLGWKKGVAGANSSLGLNYQYKSDYPKAIEHYFKALKLAEELGDKGRAAGIMRNMASVYQYQKIYPKVLEYNFKALKIFEDLNDEQGISSSLSNIGIFYFFQQDYAKALEYDFKALKISEQTGVSSSVASNMGNIGNVYLYLFDYASALNYSFRSLRLFQQVGDKYGIAIDLGNIGEIYLALARDTVRPIKPDSLIPAGKVANLRKAIEYLEKSIAASNEIGQLDNIIEFSQFLSEAYEVNGNYKMALALYKQYSLANDSVYSAGNTIKIKQTEHAHELELKDKDLQIAQLAIAKRRNERAFYIAGICLLLAIIGIVVKNMNAQKKTNRLLSDEKKRSDDLLLNILPEEVANELKATGGAEVKHFEHVTVMFTDFVNFTEAGERMSPEQLIEELHVCFKAFDGITDKYNIEKIKTIGDAYLAVSGLPVKDKDHAVHVLNAAKDINAFMEQRKKTMGNKTFEIRIGVHSGSVVAGIVGVKKFAYDIWGDTVNTASRMEEASEPGRINVSQATYELIKDKFACTYRGEIVAKNKGGLRMYFVS